MKLFFLCIFSILVFPIHAQTVNYGVANEPWSAPFGNHRAVIQINRVADVARLDIPWRLHDQNPDKKRFLIVNATTGDTVENVYRKEVNNSFCSIAFGPVKYAGRYYFYYMPYKPDPNPGYYRYGYLKPQSSDDVWIKKNDLENNRIFETLPLVEVKEIQARTSFDSFYPMEVTPTAKEKEAFFKRHPEDFLLFPESRRFPIKMKDEIPLKWIKSGPKEIFEGKASQNEYYTFQIGLYAVKTNLDSVHLKFSNLRGPDVITSDKLTCFNTEGVDSYGQSFSKRLDVSKGDVQALWIGIDLSKSLMPGLYEGTVTVSAKGEKSQIISLGIKVTRNTLIDRGDDEPWRFSRLRWLNSTKGISTEPTSPYTAIKRYGNEFYLSGKRVSLGSNALPVSISNQRNEILAAPIKYIIPNEQFSSSKISLREENDGKIGGIWTSTSKNFWLQGTESIAFDGYIHYKFRLKARHDVEMKGFRLEIPIKKGIAQYMMGMGLPGTTVPDSLQAKWSGSHDSFWIGNTYGGLYCELLGSTYHGPLLNLYKPPYPSSWYNENKGGFFIQSDKDKVIATVYSGSRVFQKGGSISFEFALLITPVKKMDTRSQFIDRYYQDADNPWPDSSAVEAGVKVINIHQGNIDNPYINYPFLAHKKIKHFTDYWHKKGIKTKIYYTVRELTNHTPELWALLSLNNEILSDGKGGGFPWLREHVITGYTPAWYTPIGNNIGKVDAAMETASGDSRWYNFYIRGLEWLIKHEDIDGIYLDDVAFDRHIIKRMREVMNNVNPGCLIDLHSNTGFSRGPAIQYTPFFPYINKLWFGESFQYNKMSSANWLVESSGIPFGLMGDMLQGGGNPWRGMIYGMTVRLPWFTAGVTSNPIHIWKIWDEFGIADAKMIGYWDKNPVIRTTNSKVLATAYVKKDKILISIASWASEPVKVKVLADWTGLGLNLSNLKFIAPAVEGFQPGRIFNLNDSIPVEPEKGWLLIAK